MTGEARVVSLDGDYAVVESRRKSACKGCHKNAGEGCGVCGLLGGDSTVRTRALNRAGAAVGDMVTVSTETRRVLWYAFIVFLMPVAAAFAGFWLGGLMSDGELLSAVLATGGMVLAFAGVWLYSRFVAGKRCDAVIVEVIKKQNIET